jgi:hypothetical protein
MGRTIQQSAMSIDYAALTQAAVAGFPEVRCCAMVSRDGLLLGCSPSAEEERAMVAWRRLAHLGEIDRGFLALRDELWVICRRGPYAALAVADPSARPGPLLDQLEQALLSAEDSRARREGVRTSPEREAPDVPRGPRSSLHREVRTGDEPEEGAGDSRDRGASAWARLLQRPGGLVAASAAAPTPTPTPSRSTFASASASASASDLEVDRVVHLPDADAHADERDLPEPSEVGVAEPEAVALAGPPAVEASADPAPAPTRERSDVDWVEIARQFAGLLKETPPPERER